MGAIHAHHGLLLGGSGGASAPLGAFVFEQSQTAGSVTASNTYVDFLDATINVTTGTNLLCRFKGAFYGVGNIARARILIDDVEIVETSVYAMNPGWAKSFGFQGVGAVSPGSRVVKVQVKTGTGLASVGFGQAGADCCLSVQEF